MKRILTHPLVVHYDDLFNTSKPTELVIQIALGGPDNQAEYTQHVGGIGRLLRQVSTIARSEQTEQQTIGAWGGRRGGGERRYDDALPGLRERERPLGGGGSRSGGSALPPAAGGGGSL